MKNLFKLLGIIALVAVIGFSFAACDNGTTDDGDGAGDGDKTLLFSVGNVAEGTNSFHLDITDPNPSEYTGNITGSLTLDDIVLTPSNIATISEMRVLAWGTTIYFINSSNDSTITVHKAGTVTVSIKEKNGYKFVKDPAGTDQYTFTK